MSHALSTWAKNVSNDHDSFLTVLAKTVGLGLLWLGGVKLADVQVLVGICSGLAVGAYAVLQFIALWRREFRGKR